MLTRVREVRELEVEVARLDEQAERARAQKTAADDALARAGEELENLRNRHHTAALAVANHEKDLERSTEKVKRIGEAQETRAAERSDLLGEQESVVEELTRLGQQIQDRRQEREQSQRVVDALGLQISSAGRDLSRRESRVAELRVAYRARDEHRLRLRETATRAEQSERETRGWIERRKGEIENARVRREELLREIEGAEAELASQLEARGGDATRERRSCANASRRWPRRSPRSKPMRGSSEAISVPRASGRARRSSSSRRRGCASTTRRRPCANVGRWRSSTGSCRRSRSSIRARWNRSGERRARRRRRPPTSPARSRASPRTTTRTPISVPEPCCAMLDETSSSRMRPIDERRREAEKVRKSLQSLGDVNLGAIEEHEELAERFRFLSEQKEDLEGTIQSLREAIARINRTSRKRFRETFELVSKRFSENFPRLFGGGKASLELTETEDVLDAGRGHHGEPPGKRLQNVNLLSGGEKTMTALALLVAVFQVRPSPFFLLDEVDAALDDANVGRFNQLDHRDGRTSPVPRDHPQQADDRGRRRPLRRDDGAARASRSWCRSS